MKTQEKRATRKDHQLRAKTRRLRAIPSGPGIELFQKEECPFSHAVRQKLSDLGLDFIAHSVPDEDSLKHQKLVEAGGKDQVPFLADHKSGVKLYESDAIIAYLDQEYGAGAGRSATSNRRLQQDLDQILYLAQRTLTDLQSVAMTSWTLVKHQNPLNRFFKNRDDQAA